MTSTGNGSARVFMERRPLDRPDQMLWWMTVVLFGYVGLRSHLLGYTWDEISTLRFARDLSWAGITESAGVHLVPTFFTRVFLELDLTGEFFVRLPGAFAFLGYAWGVIDLGRHMRRPAAVVLFMVLVLDPFTLDFFSLARGYGPAMGAMLPSLAFLLRYALDGRMRWAWLSVAMGMLSVVASYTLLNFLVPLVGVILLLTLESDRAWRARLIGAGQVMLVILAFALVLMPLLFALREKGEFFFGGRTGLYADTIASMGRCLGYHTIYSGWADQAYRMMVLVALSSGIVGVVRSIKHRSLDPLGAFGLLLLLSLLAAYAQHLLLGTHLPVERTALVYRPLVGLMLVTGLATMGNRLSHSVQIGVASLFILHFAFTANFTHTYSWRFESASKQFVQMMAKDLDRNYHVGVDHVHLQSITHYRNDLHAGHLMVNELAGLWEYCLGLEELDPGNFGVERCEKEMDADNMRALFARELDAYYLDDSYLHAMERSGIGYEVLARFPYSRSSLVRVLTN